MCVMNLVRIWCVMNSACCVGIAATSTRLIWNLLYLISTNHLIAIKVIYLCKTQILYNYQTDSPIHGSDTRSFDFTSALPLSQHLAMEGQSNFLPSIEILWYDYYFCDKLSKKARAIMLLYIFAPFWLTMLATIREKS